MTPILFVNWSLIKITGCLTSHTFKCHDGIVVLSIWSNFLVPVMCAAKFYTNGSLDVFFPEVFDHTVAVSEFDIHVRMKTSRV